MNKVIAKRKSLRDFADKRLSNDDFKMLDSWLENLPKLSDADGLDYKYFDDGAHFAGKLEGVAGYNGVMIHAPQYLVFVTKEGSSNLKSAGYAAEWVALKLTEQKIGSCWVSTNSNESKIDEILGVGQGYSVVCILAIGYPKTPSLLASIFGDFSKTRTAQQSVEASAGVNLTSRMSAKDFMYMGEFGKEADLEEVYQRGYLEAFHYMRFAPSSLNRQPWRFVIGDEYILLVVDANDGYDDDRLAYLEAGIAMLYFKVAMSSEGLDGYWDLSEDINRLGTPENYVVAGGFKARV